MAHKSSSTESDHHQIIPSHHPLVSNHQSSHISMHKDNKEKNIALILPAAAAATMNVVEAKELITTAEEEEEEEMSERERLKRHRVEVAGRVWIPEIWGQEELLKDWIDCTAFEAPLVPSKITMARKALVQQGSSSSTRSANVADLRIHNRDMEFNKHRDLSLANCTNGDVQNTQVFRRQEEHLNKKM